MCEFGQWYWQWFMSFFVSIFSFRASVAYIVTYPGKSHLSSHLNFSHYVRFLIKYCSRCFYIIISPAFFPTSSILILLSCSLPLLVPHPGPSSACFAYTIKHTIRLCYSLVISLCSANKRHPKKTHVIYNIPLKEYHVYCSSAIHFCNFCSMETFDKMWPAQLAVSIKRANVVPSSLNRTPPTG